MRKPYPPIEKTIDEYLQKHYEESDVCTKDQFREALEDHTIKKLTESMRRSYMHFRNSRLRNKSFERFCQKLGQVKTDYEKLAHKKLTLDYVQFRN
jgi:hypothetical protein